MNIIKDTIPLIKSIEDPETEVNPVVIFPNAKIAQILGFSPSWSWIGTPLTVDRKFRGISCDGVIVDCSSVCSNKDIEKIYDEFKSYAVSNPKFVFVFLE